MKLFYRSYGEGTPLIILHGLLGASGNWHSLAANVFSRNYMVLTVDQRNHGLSPHSDELSYESMVGDLSGLMDDLGLESAHLLGHSMGGKTAMHFALAHPDRVDKLIVVDIAPVDYPVLHDETFDALFAVDPSKYSSRNEIEIALSTFIPEPGVRQFLLKNVSHESGRYFWKVNLEAIRRGYDTLREAVLGWQPFDGATLFVRGGKSEYIQDEHAISIRNLFPYAETVTVENAGHWVHAEAPDRFAEIVMGFLTGADYGARTSGQR